jgi:hypothetical protein
MRNLLFAFTLCAFFGLSTSADACVVRAVASVPFKVAAANIKVVRTALGVTRGTVKAVSGNHKSRAMKRVNRRHARRNR